MSVPITTHNKRVSDLHGEALYHALTETVSVAFNDALEYGTVARTHATLDGWVRDWLRRHTAKSWRTCANTSDELSDAALLTGADSLASGVRHAHVTSLAEHGVLRSTHASGGNETSRFQFRPFRYEACCAPSESEMRAMHRTFRGVYELLEAYLPTVDAFARSLRRTARSRSLVPRGWTLDAVAIGASAPRSRGYPAHAEAGRDSLRTKNEYLVDEHAILDGPRHDRLVQQTYRFANEAEDRLYFVLHWPVGFRYTRPDGRRVEVNVEVLVLTVILHVGEGAPKNALVETYLPLTEKRPLFPVEGGAVHTLPSLGWMLHSLASRAWSRCGAFACLACLEEDAPSSSREARLRAMDALATGRGKSPTEEKGVRSLLSLLSPVLEAIRALPSRPDVVAGRVPRASLREVTVPVDRRSERVEGVREEEGGEGGAVVLLPAKGAWTGTRWALAVGKGTVLASPHDAAAHEFWTAFRLSVEAFAASHLLAKHGATPRVDFVSSEALQDTFH